MNQRPVKPVINLSAQSFDVDVDRIRKRIEVLVPNVLGNLAPSQDLARVQHQQFEQSVLLCGQTDDALAAGGCMVDSVQRQVRDCQQITMKLSASAQQCT